MPNQPLRSGLTDVARCDVAFWAGSTVPTVHAPNIVAYSEAARFADCICQSASSAVGHRSAQNGVTKTPVLGNVGAQH